MEVSIVVWRYNKPFGDHAERSSAAVFTTRDAADSFVRTISRPDRPSGSLIGEPLVFYDEEILDFSKGDLKSIRRE